MYIRLNINFVLNTETFNGLRSCFKVIVYTRAAEAAQSESACGVQAFQKYSFQKNERKCFILRFYTGFRFYEIRAYILSVLHLQSASQLKAGERIKHLHFFPFFLELLRKRLMSRIETGWKYL